MKSAPLALASVLAAGLAATPARAEKTPTVPAPTLLAVAAGDARLKTFSALVERAGLTEALLGPGPLTVFAPTNEAFARLPADTLRDLLQDEAVPALRSLLLAHVVEGRVVADDLLRVRRATSLGGTTLGIGLKVGEADVIEADRVASNGVIHLVDRVLPGASAQRETAQRHVGEVLHAAIAKGVPLFNDGDPEACRTVYAGAARALLEPGAPTHALHRIRLERALSDEGDAVAGAWALRRAFDGILADLDFEPRMEASLPAGFPAPGPVGAVTVKRYPAYRAARAEGGSAFWRLFNHIKDHDVAMTAPVEMTLGDDLGMVDMAFLYERPDQGDAGADGSVRVLDLEERTVLSVGVRGARDGANLRDARRVLEAMVEREAWVVAGPYRVLGYNSPMVPAGKRYWELQVPVQPRAQ